MLLQSHGDFRGIIPRTLQQIFDQVEDDHRYRGTSVRPRLSQCETWARKGSNCSWVDLTLASLGSVVVSYVQLYKEQIQDLFTDSMQV